MTELMPRCKTILKQINGDASLAIRYSVDEGVDTDLTSGLSITVPPLR